MALSNTELARYQRHLSLTEVGRDGQEKLKAARVVVIGAGGLGSPSALYLAASGIGTLGLVDCDRVDVSNLQRQVLFGTADIGRPKAEAARERLQALNPEIDIRAHAVELRAGNVREVLRDYDIVLDGTDRLSTRYLVNDACVLMGKPLVTAAIHRFEGQAMTCVPGQGPCYRCLFAEADDSVVPNCAEAGVLGVLPGVLGTLQAAEAIKLVLGAGAPLTGRLLTFDALEMSFQEFRFNRRADCAVCGDHPTITELKDPEVAPGDACVPIRRLDAAAVRALIASGSSADAPLLLVDVREPWEFEGGHIDRSVSIPLGELPARIGEIPHHANAVFICAVGARSFAACQMALQAGITSPANLEGGMRSWMMGGYG